MTARRTAEHAVDPTELVNHWLGRAAAVNAPPSMRLIRDTVFHVERDQRRQELKNRVGSGLWRALNPSPMGPIDSI